MKRVLPSIIAISIILLLCACGKAENISEKAETLSAIFPIETMTVSTETVESKIDPKDIDEILQGTWTYVDTNIGSTEVIHFDNGVFSFTYTLDAVPDKASGSTGDYTIYDGYISIYFPETDYTNIMNYSWLGEELVIHKYIETGADKGNTRVYVKQDTVTPGITLPTATEPVDYAPAYTVPTYANITAGMRNALQSAENYLSIMPFSHAGLVEQLEFEGYSSKEAAYAADNCGADWYEQAAWCAKNYLDIMPFSRSGLIEQLEFDGYTYEQAVYGVDKAY